MNERIVYSQEQMMASLDDAMKELNTFRYDRRFREALGEALIKKVSAWEETILSQKNNPFTLVVIGDFKRGKSTLINALLGEEVVTSDVTTETVTLNQLDYGTHSNEAILSKNRRALLSDAELKREQLEKVIFELNEPVEYLELKRSNLLQNAMNTCMEYHEDKLYEMLADLSDEVSSKISDILPEQRGYQFRVNLDNRIWTKGDTVGLVTSQLANFGMLGTVASLVSDGITGMLREKESEERVPELMKQISQKILGLQTSISQTVAKQYGDLENNVEKVITSYFRNENENKKNLMEQTMQTAAMSAKEKENSQRIIEEARNIILCKALQHKADMVGVQLHKAAAYHLGGLIVPGNAQRLAVGGAGVHQQIHDLIEGIFIIRVKPEQKVYL